MDARELLRWMPGSWGCFSKTFSWNKVPQLKLAFVVTLQKTLITSTEHLVGTVVGALLCCTIIIMNKYKHRGHKLEDRHGDEERNILNTCVLLGYIKGKSSFRV